MENEYLHCIENEMELVNIFKNPFIIHFYSYFEDYNYIYFLLENIDGLDLDSIMNNLIDIPKNQYWFYTTSIIENAFY